MIIWTLGLTLLGGALNLMTWIKPPRGISFEANTVEASKVASRSDRAPASSGEPKKDISQFAVRLLDEKTLRQAIEFDLLCPKKGAKEEPVTETLNSTVAQVRLTGSSCMKDREIASTEIKNEANGFSATVFATGPHSFTTDYISLVKGENKIRILHIFTKGGREEKQWVFKRL
jgi:hypothetical protein